MGVALRWPDAKTEYLAWGHPEGNTNTEEEAHRTLSDIAASGVSILTHNGAGFDIPILEHFTGIKIEPLRVEDTLFLAYLHNPHAKSLALKWLAEHWLGMPPDAQDELNDWIMANTDCASRKKCGAYISQAPAGLVGKYAISDVEMTFALYEHLKDKVLPLMQEPYDRERRLAPILADMQVRGVRVDVPRLTTDYHQAQADLAEVEGYIRRELHAPDLALDKDAQLIAALQAKGFTEFLTTPTGKLSASKDSLAIALDAHPVLRDALRKRGALATLTGTFIGPWLEIAANNGGRLHASYNQVRSPNGYGTRTGRLSSSHPNLGNVPNTILDDIPQMKDYLLPDDGQVWLCADAKSQEPRITSHFEDSLLLEAFIADPNLDPYQFVADAANCTRKEAKVVLLGILYGMGAATLAEGLGCSEQEAIEIRSKVRFAIPGIVELDRDCKQRWRRGLPIKTLGGRLAYCEPPSNGREWYYKCLNYLAQGSAADQTKQWLIYVVERLLPSERLVSTVYDEVSVSCSPERVEAIAEIMEVGLNALPCDCPMLISYDSGANWSEAK